MRLIMQLYTKLLNILNYPSGYTANNKLFIVYIIFSALGAYLVRIFGFDNLDL